MNATFIRSHLGAMALAATLILSACGGGDASPPAESVPPTVNIASSVISGAAAGPVTFTFTFSEDVGASFTADAVSVSNGSKGAFTKVSATQYTLVVTPAANSAGNIGVSIAANTVADLVGNKMPVAATQSQGFDTRPPTVAITNNASGGVAKGIVTFTFNFSKDVGTSFTADDVVVTGGGTKGAFARISSTQFTLVVTPTANSSGTLNVSIAAAAFTDAGGAGNPAPTAVQLAFDTVPKTQMSLPVSFDVATVDYGFIGFGGAEDSSIAADPTNAANKVARVVRAAGSETYAGTTITGAAQLGFSPKVPFTANDTRISVRVRSPDAGIPVRLKLEDHTDPTKSVEAQVNVTQANTWETLTFNFAPGSQVAGTTALNLAVNYTKATIFFDFGRDKAQSVQKTYYFDDITFVPGTPGGGGACGSTAPTCAPTTTIAAGSVVIYSDAATVAGFNPRPDWGQTVTYSEANIAGNKSLKYTFQAGGFGTPGAYEGMDWAGSPQNVSTKSKLRMDVWSNDLTSLKISIISAGKETAVTQALTKGIWNALDIDLAAFTEPDKTAIIQIKIESATAGDVYIDNIHFTGSGSTGCGTTAPTCAPTTTVPAGSVVIYSEAATVAGFNPRPDWGQTVTFSEANIAGNKSLKYTFQAGGFGTPGAYEGMDWAANPVNVAAKTKLHMDLWSNDLTSLKISIISAGKENAVTQAITKGSWNSVDIDLSAYTVPDKSAIIQIKIESATAGDIYIDNIYFWGGSAASCGTTVPTCAPGTSIPAGSVVIYSEAATVAGFNPRPDWGQTVTFSEATIAGNKSLKYTFQAGGYGTPGAYEGMDWAGSPQNVASKGKLHLDIWSADITSMKISIISAGKENAVTQAITAGSWNSVDIELASYNVPDKSAIIQIKIESATAGTVYIDNIHFWGTASGGGGGTPNPAADPGSAGPVTIPVATASDKFGFILANDAIFAADYIGSLDTNGKRALYAGATSAGAASNGNIGFYNDNLLSTSSQKLEEGGWIVGSIDDPNGVPNFFRYFVLTGPGSTFSSSFMGLFVNAPNNGTVNVSSYGNIKFKLWGPAEMYQQSNLNPTVEMIFAGPKVAGCTATGSGGTEISKTFVANQKIGAGTNYKIPLAAWTVKGVCGTDTNSTAVATVLSKLARIVFNVPASSFNFINANPGTPVSYSSGINLGPIGFTNQ